MAYPSIADMAVLLERAATLVIHQAEPVLSEIHPRTRPVTQASFQISINTLYTMPPSCARTLRIPATGTLKTDNDNTLYVNQNDNSRRSV